MSLTYLEQLCTQGIIEYPGMVSNIPEWLSKSSVFVLPSYYREGVPRSTQEAMAIGRAVITTDVPGCRETVEHKRNGLMIPPHDINALVDAMCFFIENPDQVLKMGTESHTIATAKFDARVVNERLYRLVMAD
ncbi:glycosyltransferase [Endozoicomonas sp.]|nr:glycosyltransferase [Endozoicomonas sp.]